MFNSIILDKSAFQALNIDEIFFLRNYYFPIVSHILIVEILADLKKGNNLIESRKQVCSLAHKILLLNPTYNIQYSEQISMELLGKKVEMSRRPIVAQGKPVIHKDGKKGFVCEQAFEESILLKWRDNKFDETEKMLAEQWRKSTQDNTISIDSHSMPEGIKKLKTVSDIRHYVDKYLELPVAQKDILYNILSIYHVSSQIASKAFHRYESSEYQLIKDFAPYSIYCYRSYMIFLLSIFRGITTPRITDILDLQYLYYLPFVSIFVSDDRFHRLFTPVLKSEDQLFFRGIELKNDLELIVAKRDTFPESEKEKWILDHRNFPPKINDSIRYKLWNNNVDSFNKEHPKCENKHSPTQEKEIVDRIQRLSKSLMNKNYSGSFKDNETDFIIREKWIGPNDFCPCGSGKLFKDYHLLNVKKDT